MLIAQVTDIHLGFDPDNPAEFNRKRLDQVIAMLRQIDPQPDMLMATGDLIDRGDEDSYRRLKNAFSVLPFPVHMCMGNHDQRDTFSAQFPEVPVVDGFVQYEVEAGPLRVLVLDTLEEGRHGGAFCEVRAAWLTARLAEAPNRPTLIVQHHPPIEVGIPWMNTHPEEAWVHRLSACFAGQNQIVGMICGHVHRAIVSHWNGFPVAICPSSAPQVALELAPIDPDTPDGRNMIIADAPAFALHWWNGRELITHYETADEHVMLARYDEKMQPLVRSLLAERP
ncbi:phosphodiesterase [Blastomonas sp.]|uniref:phosphodiesterase n=1 Tax=Blastomonas sp. TaxID=1909299 RepID=UPI0035934795